jgi:type II secretory pathway component PulF
MTAFRFRAARPDGEVLTGTVQASSAAAALRLVESRGLLPVALDEAAATAPRRVDPATLAAVLAGLAALVDAGLPVDRALAAAQETAPDRLRDALAQGQAAVREGGSLSAALAEAGLTPPTVLGHLRAGERAGALGAALARGAADLERTAELRARIRTALTYPVFLLVAGTISVLVIVGVVVPRFAHLLGEQGHALPASTRLLLAASSVVRGAALPGLILGVLLAAPGFRWLRAETGRLALHQFLLALPFVGALRHQLASARTCGALGGLLEAGVPVLEAMRLASEAAGDAAVRERMLRARLDVERGERLGRALRQHGALTPAALRLAAFGERAGALPRFLAHAAWLEETAAHRALQRAVTLLEPAIILAFGAAVAFVALALLQAVYSVRPAGA